MGAVGGQLGGRLKRRPGVAAPAVTLDELWAVGAPVILHVYDVLGGRSVQLVNELFRPMGAGAFHAGVEVYRQEWSFGWTQGRGTGVFACSPRRNLVHRYRESVSLGRTHLTESEVSTLIEVLKGEWLGKDYDLVRNNCCDFAAALASGLEASPPPEWVNSLAGSGGRLLQGWHAAQELFSATWVVLEALQAEGKDLATLTPWDRSQFVRLAVREPHPIGPQHQPALFDRVLGPVGAQSLAADGVGGFFQLCWRPPMLCLTRGTLSEVAIYVDGALLLRESAVLLTDAEVTLCPKKGHKPLVTFRVLRNPGAANMKWAAEAFRCKPAIVSPRTHLKIQDADVLDLSGEQEEEVIKIQCHEPAEDELGKCPFDPSCSPGAAELEDPPCSAGTALPAEQVHL